MKYGSLFSGIEAASVAWHSLGWEPEFFAEIEKFPCSALKERFPAVPNYGDVTKFKEWPDHAIDVLVGGSPCQSFSIAGLRKGLDDPRGNLMLTYLAIVARYRPKWMVWENVPGVLSSNGGRDFGTFLGALGQLGYGFSYRVLDAQYIRSRDFPHAVPQRRRRVFVVGHLGDWRPAAAVLFDAQSLRGDPPPRRETGQITSGTISSRTPGGGGVNDGLIPDVSNALAARDYKQPRAEDGVGIIPVQQAISFGAQMSVPQVDVGVNQTLQAKNPMAVSVGMAVRRLTPTECERLQGFPDGWTLVTHRKKPAADGPRYKALGNSMAVNAMQWIGERIQLIEEQL